MVLTYEDSRTGHGLRPSGSTWKRNGPDLKKERQKSQEVGANPADADEARLGPAGLSP